MKFSVEWLKDWVAVPGSVDELAERLTMAGLEVEGIESAAPVTSGVFVGSVVDVQPHPNADRLRVCQVDTGAGELHQIVCGAPNVRPGLRVAAALPGAVLPGDFKIGKAKLRGVESGGMLCSADELKLDIEGDGLLELPADAPVGMALPDYLKLNDSIIELNVTPNRGDCLGILGIAREVAANYRLPLAGPGLVNVESGISDTLPITLSAPEACPRFAGRIVRGINADQASPLWMQERLRRCGIRPISVVVDITNYVMLELGQPMHAYDMRLIDGGIHARYARPNECLELLDGQQLALNPQTLVIADDRKALGAAGIMGGKASGISTSTTDVFLESAFFAPLQLAGEARRYRMHTDASHRFERGVDFSGQRRALERATELVVKLCGGQAGPIVEQIVDEHLPARNSIDVRQSRVTQIIGCSIDAAEIDQILSHLGLTPERTPDGWRVIPGPARFDLTLEIDIIEEIARLYGYDAIPSAVPRGGLNIGMANGASDADRRVRDVLVDRGFYEAITYSFIDSESNLRIDPASNPEQLLNPISAEMAIMRTTIWPGLLKAARHNRNRQHERVRLFEVGPVYGNAGAGSAQSTLVAGLACGPVYPLQWGASSSAADFFDLKADLESVLQAFGCDAAFVPATHPALHPGQSARIEIYGKSVGWIGSLHPGLRGEFDLDQPVMLFELDMSVLQQRPVAKARAVSPYPSVRRDINVVVHDGVTAAAILATIRQRAPAQLRDLQLFDVYRGQGIESGKKSVTLGLIFQASSSTLTDAYVDETVGSIVAGLGDELGAVLRA
ncbi:MAG: phenylalanine--tRNA ligase subunit beta [Gammaproteobacteria bacterium]|nr:phenylalanine--tRNA ligase subunit beta [Gammaproteobacteria bacterium]